MIHKIKALYDNGKGMSIRAIADELKISRNTVRKYFRMGEVEVAEMFDNPARRKALDDYEEYIVHLLEECPLNCGICRRTKSKEGGWTLPASMATAIATLVLMV